MTRHPYSQTQYGHAPLLRQPRGIDLAAQPICHIVGSLRFSESIGIPLSEKDERIAADGGLDLLSSRGLAADAVIGDGDSRLHDTAESARPPEAIRLPIDKDDTDLTEAVRWGWQKGFRRFRLYGCLGGRWDHTLLNLNLLAYIARNGGIGELVGKDQAITAIDSARLRFQAPSNVLDLPDSASAVGVIPVSDHCAGIDILGLKYRAEDVRGGNDEPLWSSNSFTENGAIATVGCRMGIVDVVYPAGCRLVDMAAFRAESPSLGSPVEGTTLNLSHRTAPSVDQECLRRNGRSPVIMKVSHSRSGAAS